jgi:hypothetical protein
MPVVGGDALPSAGTRRLANGMGVIKAKDAFSIWTV